MNKLTTAAFLFFFLPHFCEAQKKDAYDEKYEWRIRQEVLYGVYIPKDVPEAFFQLNRLIDEKSKAKFKAIPEAEVDSKLFFSLGRWMTYNWSLFDGSRLSVHLQELGVHHPEDMARFIMIAYHRSLNKKPLEIQSLLEVFHEKSKREKEDRLKSGTIIHEETRKVPKENGGQKR